MPQSPDRQKRARRSAQARQIASYSLGHLIETANMPDETRNMMRTAFVGAMLAGGEQKVLSTLCAQVASFKLVLPAIAAVIDEQLQNDPDHFLHEVMDVPHMEQG